MVTKDTLILCKHCCHIRTWIYNYDYTAPRVQHTPSRANCLTGENYSQCIATEWNPGIVAVDWLLVFWADITSSSWAVLSILPQGLCYQSYHRGCVINLTTGAVLSILPQRLCYQSYHRGCVINLTTKVVLSILPQGLCYQSYHWGCVINPTTGAVLSILPQGLCYQSYHRGCVINLTTEAVLSILPQGLCYQSSKVWCTRPCIVQL